MPHVQRQTQGRHLCVVAPEDPLGQRQELVLFQLGVGGVFAHQALHSHAIDIGGLAFGKSNALKCERMPSWQLEKMVSGALLSLWPGVAGARQPMLPFLAQGAGMAVEYAVVPGRCLGPVTDRGQVAGALQA